MLTLVQIDPEVPAGTIADFLAFKRIPFQTIRVFSGEPLPRPCASSAVIVLGGAMEVHDVALFPYLREVKSYVLSAAAADVPFLGICLGGQLLADALGARVHSGRFGEKGVRKVRLLERSTPEPLFFRFPEQFDAFQWHDDSFELPAGATLLASSEACANQAFRFGKHSYGLQFHPEVTRDIVSSWSGNSPDGPHASDVMDEFLRAEESYRSVSFRLFENFLRIARLTD